MRSPTRSCGAITVFIASILISATPTVLAEEAHPIDVRAIIKAGEACPTTPVPATVPQFRAGQTMTLCLAQPASTSGPTNITVGQLPGAVGTSTPDSVLVSIPEEPSAGSYAVAGTVNGATISQSLIKYFPTPKPTLSGLSSTAIARGAPVRIDGENLAAPLENISVSIGNETADVKDVDPDGKWLVAMVKASEAPAPAAVQQPVRVTVWDIPATPQTGPLLLTLQGTDTGQTVGLAGLSLMPLAVVLGLILVVYYSQRRKSRNVLAALLYDNVTQTYSLSRAQFFWWLTIGAYSYSFLFIGRGMTAGNWAFPPLNGLLLTLVISTGTLLGAIVTGNVRGQKGSGAVHPAPADLIMHGGVIAPERIQQVLWSFLAGIAVVWIVVTTYTTATALPDIPQELLTLMGLSSVAYVTGKIVRSPGPIIRQVDVEPNTTPVELLVSGDCLDRDAAVTVNGTRLPKASIDVEPAKPNTPAANTNKQLVSRLRLTTTIDPDVWSKGPSHIVIVNTDGQRSEWPTPEPAPEPVPAAAPAKVAGQPGLAPL
jgi:hypothetical protein